MGSSDSGVPAAILYGNLEKLERGFIELLSIKTRTVFCIEENIKQNRQSRCHVLSG